MPKKKAEPVKAEVIKDELPKAKDRKPKAENKAIEYDYASRSEVEALRKELRDLKGQLASRINLK